MRPLPTVSAVAKWQVSCSDNMDEELVRLYFESQEQHASSSMPRRQRRNIESNREEGHDRLFNDYFFRSSSVHKLFLLYFLITYLCQVVRYLKYFHLILFIFWIF